MVPKYLIRVLFLGVYIWKIIIYIDYEMWGYTK